MYTLSKIKDRYTSADHKEYLCFTDEDFNTLKQDILSGKEQCAPSSTCLVLPGTQYIYTGGEWLAIS